MTPADDPIRDALPLADVLVAPYLTDATDRSLGLGDGDLDLPGEWDLDEPE